jgi:hydrogenase expression/formation protein HypE
MEDKILLAHGSGGKLSHDLVKQNFVPLFDNALLNRLDDSAVFELKGDSPSPPTAM